MPLTLRLIFHSFRSVMLGLMIMLVGWVGLTPATPNERQALGARPGEERPQGLVAMRVAQAFVHFAPDRAATMLSDASNGEISAELAGMMLRQMAKGPMTPAELGDAVSTQTIEVRDRTGAKFIRPD